jgi:hypothetical protein
MNDETSISEEKSEFSTFQLVHATVNDQGNRHESDSNFRQSTL